MIGRPAEVADGSHNDAVTIRARRYRGAQRGRARGRARAQQPRTPGAVTLCRSTARGCLSAPLCAVVVPCSPELEGRAPPRSDLTAGHAALPFARLEHDDVAPVDHDIGRVAGIFEDVDDRREQLAIGLRQ